jgi:Tol biopolymer transport system component/serine/threonine protein kinase
MILAAGDRLGPYEILGPLGAGGMGEVYRARDPRLNREVAVKVLRDDRLADPARRQRFLQEARAASALNHPNIVTIHDIGVEGDTVFLVMELIDGKSLDRLIPAGGFRVSEILRIGAQIAGGFATAHAASIVHRDLKPANIMLTSDGLVKVLDFGLAKLAQSPASAGDAGETAAGFTREGTILGTPAYMSPEQAEGKPLDPRSDIFSFGAVLYEMATGRRAFRGDTQMSVVASVIREDPTPPSAVRADLPPELARIVQRCLRKELSRRAQSMADLKVALEELKEESDSGLLTARPAPASAKPRRLWPIAAAAAAVAIASFAGWRIWSARSVAEVALQPVPLTSFPGDERWPDFSPDGNQIAFMWNGERGDNADIYVIMIGSGTPLRLTTDPAPDYAPAWSPDGRQIAFLRIVDRGTIAVMLVPPLGGPERKVAQLHTTANLAGPLASLCWAADAGALIVAGSETPGQANRLLLVPVAGGPVRTLAEMEGVGHGYANPKLSPDGRTLAALAETGARRVHVWSVSGDLDLRDRRVLNTGAASVGALEWAADSRDLVFSIAVTTPLPLNRIPAAGGAPRALNWTGGFTGSGVGQTAIAPRGNRMVFVRTTRDTNLWQVSLERLQRGELVRQPVAVSSFREVAPAYSPDGKRLAFYSNRGGSIQIWTADADGSRPVQLTNMDPRATTGTPRWSPDSRWIAFDSEAGGQYNVYVIGADGGQARALTTGRSNNFVASWSPDGRWIYFTSNRSGAAEIWRAPSGGGEPEQMTRYGGQAPAVSPDGKWLYYTKADGAAGLWRMPLAGGDEDRVVESVYRYNYAVTGQGVYWVPAASLSGPSPVRYLDFAAKAARDVFQIEKSVDLGLAVSPDGKFLLYAQRDYEGQDLMLVEGFR